MEGQLVPELGSILAGALTPGHIKEFVLKRDNTAKTIRNVLSPLRLALDDAVEDRVIAQNPMDLVNLDKIIGKIARASDFEIDPFDAKERAAFLEACRNEEEQDQYIFWFDTGLRPGELIALGWPKIDWINSLARIDASVFEQVEKGPKTQAGIRDMELTPAALAALGRQKGRTFLAGGRIWGCPVPLVGGGRHGRDGQLPWTDDQQLRKSSYYVVMKRAKVRHRNMYQIRHTYASVHASAGRNLFWLAGQMGHETIEMIIRHYARWIPGSSTASGGEGQLGHAAVTQNSGSKIIRFKPIR